MRRPSRWGPLAASAFRGLSRKPKRPRQSARAATSYRSSASPTTRPVFSSDSIFAGDHRLQDTHPTRLNLGLVGPEWQQPHCTISHIKRTCVNYQGKLGFELKVFDILARRVRVVLSDTLLPVVLERLFQGIIYGVFLVLERRESSNGRGVLACLHAPRDCAKPVPDICLLSDTPGTPRITGGGGRV